MNVAWPASPVVPVTAIVYSSPIAPATTVKEPDRAPEPEIEHSGLEMILVGEDVIVHDPASPAAKLEPETRTLVPGRPDVGFTVTEGSSVKVAVA